MPTKTDEQKARERAHRNRQKDEKYHEESHAIFVSDTTQEVRTGVKRQKLVAGEDEKYAAILRTIVLISINTAPRRRMWECISDSHARDAILNEDPDGVIRKRQDGDPVAIRWMEIARASLRAEVHQRYRNTRQQHDLPDFQYPPPKKEEGSIPTVEFGTVGEPEGSGESEEEDENDLCTLCGAPIEDDEESEESSAVGRRYHVECPDPEEDDNA